jgi:transposase InsO family protein
VRFAFIAKEADAHSIRRLCRVLEVSPAGYYAWGARATTRRACDDDKLKVLVSEAFERSHRRYGSPRIHQVLAEGGVHVSRKRVIRAMQSQALVARGRRRFKCTTNSDHSQPVMQNLLKRKFRTSSPNQCWVGDTTELYVGRNSDKLYLAVLIDLYSRLVVGWALSRFNDRRLVMDAFEAGVANRRPPNGLIQHTDQGSTYASDDYQHLLAKHGVVSSMSRRANCLDNAVAESWFSTLKAELAERFETQDQARREIFEYIEAFYNRVRIHSSLGYLSPWGFERRLPTAA